MLDPRRLLTFREVARQGSFSRAADALALSQPAVSQQVSALERELGTALLVRGRAGTVPTPAGELLLAHADALAGRLELADEQMGAIVDTARRTLKVGAFPSALATIVPGALATLRDHEPDLDASIEEGTIAELTAAVQSGRLHAAVCFQDASAPRREPEGLRRADLLEEPMVGLLRADHRLAGHEAIDLRELAGEPWMAPSLDGLIVAGCRAAGFEPNVIIITRDALTACAIAATGLAVSLTPQLLTRTEFPGVAMPRLKKSPPRRTIYALLPGAGAHPLAEPLLDALLQAATTAPPRRGSPPPANTPVTGSRSTA